MTITENLNKHKFWNTPVISYGVGIVYVPQLGTELVEIYKRCSHPYSGGVAENCLVVLTGTLSETLGDITSVIKTIKRLKRTNPGLKIQWIIQAPRLTVIPEAAKNIADSMIVVTQMEQIALFKLAEKEIILSDMIEYLEKTSSDNNDDSLPVPYYCYNEAFWFNKAALIIHLPSFRELPAYLIDFINYFKPQKTTIKTCNEYDFKDHLTPEVEYCTMGLRKDSCGIFIKPPKPLTVQLLLEQIIKLEPPIPTFSSFLFADHCTPENYTQDHLFYFAYFNQDYSLSTNNVNAEYFIKIVTSIVEETKAPHTYIDIVCHWSNLTKEHINNALLINNIREIQVSSKNGNFTLINADKGEKILRLYTQFPFSNKIFKKLIHLSYLSTREANLPSLIGCTGDQSLSEVLSLRGAIPYYQIMRWKKGLYYGLCDSVSNKNSSLSEYLIALENYRDRRQDWTDKIVKYLLSPEVTSQAEVMHDDILRDKNIDSTLIPELNKLIQESLDDSETSDLVYSF